VSAYAHPEVLVSTGWVAEHGGDENVRLVEVDVDTLAYKEGHIKGAVGINWTSQLCDHIRRDILTREQFEALCSSSGIGNDTTVVFYGDNNNWFACYALWQFRLYGHAEDKLKIMNGGRAKWIEEGRPLSQSKPAYPAASYKAAAQDRSVRAGKDDVFEALEKGAFNLVDTRSPAEYTGTVIAPAGMNETAQRGGHIPGARSIPWARTVNDDGTFKTRDEIRALYEQEGVDLNRGTIAYCRIGERSSHSWFVLKYLLGADQVTNYDGGWTEWGNLVGAPIEKGK
jgi:thiosulfate/3-mercaptopyruvate sulfurtransferase